MTVGYKAVAIGEWLPRVEHTPLALIACDIGLYIPVFFYSPSYSSSSRINTVYPLIQYF
jgi:hypothetical protein